MNKLQNTHAHTHTHIYIYIYMQYTYIDICVDKCVNVLC